MLCFCLQRGHNHACPLCDKSFNKITELVKHRRIDHASDKQKDKRNGRQMAFRMGDGISNALKKWQKTSPVQRLLSVVGGVGFQKVPPLQEVHEYLESLEDLPEGAASKVIVWYLIFVSDLVLY